MVKVCVNPMYDLLPLFSMFWVLGEIFLENERAEVLFFVSFSDFNEKIWYYYISYVWFIFFLPSLTKNVDVVHQGELFTRGINQETWVMFFEKSIVEWRW